MTLNQAAFIVLALAALLGAAGVVFLKSPVRAALALVVNFFTLGLVYFMLGSQMLGITQIMVYAGAIMVLFLFVIMILKSQPGQDGEDVVLWRDPRFAFGLIGTATTVALIYNFVIRPTQSLYGLDFDRSYGTPQAIGNAFFTTYVFPFEVISILLLIGVVGSILLAKRKF